MWRPAPGLPLRQDTDIKNFSKRSLTCHHAGGGWFGLASIRIQVWVWDSKTDPSALHTLPVPASLPLLAKWKGRMPVLKTKVPGRYRTRTFAKAFCTVSVRLQEMAPLEGGLRIEVVTAPVSDVASQLGA